MSVIDKINQTAADQGLGNIVTCQPLAGGSICDSFKCITDKHINLFAKTLSNAPTDLFAAEAAGLKAIAATDTVRTPCIYNQTPDYLLLEFLEPGEANTGYWEELGAQLAMLHKHHSPCFGFNRDNYCGATSQPNPKTESGHRFFAEHRLMYQANMAAQKGLLSGKELARFQSLADNLENRIPEQPPCLIHGDLWSGNTYCAAPNIPLLIDPACYWGWAEAEIAMTLLFGGFPAHFYDAYMNGNRLESDWQDRAGLYNLYHLLNHLNLFGSQYHNRLTTTLDRYI